MHRYGVLGIGNQHQGSSVLGSISFDLLYNKIQKRQLWKDLKGNEMFLSISGVCMEPSCPSTLSLPPFLPKTERLMVNHTEADA